MSIISVIAICSALTVGSIEFEQKGCPQAVATYQSILKNITLSADDREAITRVSYAEAANQGTAGLAGVVYTILNRLISQDFGGTISDILNSPHQFEPVHRAGGWQNLPPATDAQKAQINTIINLVLDGHLPDLTKGALFFQNPKIVKLREAKGTVSKGLTHFGGAQPSIVIKDHAFYPTIRNGHRAIKKTHKRPKDQKLLKIQHHPPNDVFGQQITDIFLTKTTEKNLLVTIQ